MENVYIITGTTKGIGKAFVEVLLRDKKNYIISLSRAENSSKNNFINYTCDLIEPDENILQEIFSNVVGLNPDKIFLINNAGQLTPIDKLGNCNNDELRRCVSVNLTAPLILINSFLSQTLSGKAEKVIINISSGAASSPYSGWSAYCSSKAGVDMLTKTVAVEQHPLLKIVSIAPGVVDTGMQDLIRSTPKESFEMVDKFMDLKKDGYLYQPDDVAERIIDFLDKNLFESGEIYDLRDL